jgi:hypothetical protein
MTTITRISDYLSHLIEKGFGHYSLKLGTRGLESLRPDGREIDLCPPDCCAETANDGRKVAYLRAGDGD